MEVRSPPTATARAFIRLSGTDAGRIAWKNRQHNIGGIENTSCTFLHSSPARCNCLLHSQNQAFTLAWRALVHNLRRLLSHKHKRKHKHASAGARESLDYTTAIVNLRGVPQTMGAFYNVLLALFAATG